MEYKRTNMIGIHPANKNISLKISNLLKYVGKITVVTNISKNHIFFY